MFGQGFDSPRLHESCKPLNFSGFFYILRIDNTPKRPAMEVEFRPTAEDYRGFYRYFIFRRYLGMKIAVIGLFSFWVGQGFVGRHFSLIPYLLYSLAVWSYSLLLCHRHSL